MIPMIWLTLACLHFACLHQTSVSLNKLDNRNWAQLSNRRYVDTKHVARIISSQKIYSLYARKHHIMEMRGDVTDAGRTTKTEDRATQPMEAGG